MKKSPTLAPTNLSARPSFDAELEEKDEAERQHHRAYSEILDAAGFDVRHRQPKSADLARHAGWKAAVDGAWGMVQAGGVVVLLGDRGNGKTQAAYELARRAAWHGQHSTRYLRCREVGMEIRRAYGKDGEVTEAEAVSQFVRPWLLVLDECQERMDTDHEARTLTLILDKRYGAVRPTVLIANTTEAGFRLLMRSSVIDRIKEGGGIRVFGWGSFRQAK